MVKCSKSKVQRLKTALLRWKDMAPIQRERIRMVLMRENGMTQPEIVEGTGVSLSTVNRAHMLYDEGGQGAQAKTNRQTQAREHDSCAGKSFAGGLCQSCWR